MQQEININLVHGLAWTLPADDADGQKQEAEERFHEVLPCL
jgi:hypothetical protein